MSSDTNQLWLVSHHAEYSNANDQTSTRSWASANWKFSHPIICNFKTVEYLMTVNRREIFTHTSTSNMTLGRFHLGTVQLNQCYVTYNGYIFQGIKARTLKINQFSTKLTSFFLANYCTFCFINIHMRACMLGLTNPVSVLNVLKYFLSWYKSRTSLEIVLCFWLLTI